MTKTVIMQVLPALESGGVEYTALEIAAGLQQAGIKNIVVSNGGVLVRELNKIKVPHLKMPVHSKNPVKIVVNAFKLARVAKEKGVTLMHVHSRAPAWVVRMASRLTGIPFVTTFHGVYEINPSVFKKPYNRVMVAGRLVMAVSNHVKTQIMRDYNVPESKIRLVHGGTDEKRFNPKGVSSHQMAEFMKKYGIPEDKPIIMVQGRLTSWKGQMAMIEALSKMKHKAVTCLFIGSHQGRLDYVSKLKEKMAQLSPKTSVMMFALSGKEMPTAYALSDIVASVSLKPEPFGRAMPEAQAMGRIVVAFNHGGACETVEDGKTGILVKPCDTDDLARKLDKALSMTPEAQKKMALAAQKSVHTHFSIEKMQETVMAVYAEVLEDVAKKKDCLCSLKKG